MPPRKTPKRSLQARTSVAARVISSMDSPDWKPASEFTFKTPASPSPVKKTTRRSSVYKASATSKTSTRTSTFKMPCQRLTSPPGVKTRARRSSVYKRGGVGLTSPPSSRTRRRSMYVSSKPGLPAMAEFSKVWATPVRQVEPVMMKSPDKPEQSPAKSHARKTPKIVKPVTPVLKKTPAKSEGKKTNKSPAVEGRKTPDITKEKTPAKLTKSVKKSLKLDEKTPVKKDTAAKTKPTPKVKTPKSALKSSTKKRLRASSTVSSPLPTSTQQKPTPKVRSPKSALKSSTKKRLRASSTVSSPLPTSTLQKLSVKPVITSTPSKTIQDITGKSFYGTPSETPIPLQRTDDIFVFSAQPAKSAKKTSVKKATILSPKITPHKRKMKTPKKTPLRKTPAAKKRSRDDSAAATPSAKRAKTTSSSARVVRSTKLGALKTPSPSKSPDSPTRTVLSPSEMTSILMDVVETERLEESRTSLSPSPRPRKLAKLSGEVASLSTPRIRKVAKRASPKKLAEIQDRNQSCGGDSDKQWASVVSSNTSILDETINTDSRNVRCIIL